MAAGGSVPSGIAHGIDTTYPPENRKFMVKIGHNSALATVYPYDR
jgi:predicted Rossmann fold nucleotide-binding protein DprA/Smf involved in DNA uptake